MSASPPVVGSGLYPLDDFYALRGEVLPAYTNIEAEEMPEPQRTLLAHQHDMTSTLENFYGRRLHVELLERHKVEGEYGREVALCLDQTGKRVEFGAIKIMLCLLPSEAQQEILLERKPLGRILTDARVVFASRPRHFLSVTSDEFINRALGVTGTQTLYGRRNTLFDSWERPLAEIVEILPPV